MEVKKLLAEKIISVRKRLVTFTASKTKQNKDTVGWLHRWAGGAHNLQQKALYTTLRWRACAVGKCSLLYPSIRGAIAVSYTHLDVYKRQSYQCIKY